MPTISMFYGIIVRMYYAPGEHPPPHFHAYYAEYEVVIGIEKCDIIRGHFPKKQENIILAWASLHQDELMANWKLVMNSEPPFSIQRLN